MAGTQDLLAEYVQTGSETAFRELVNRYVDLVYSVALRLVNGDTHRAEDVSQMVFSDLASLARKLPPGVMLGGWLHRHTCFLGAKVMRGERRQLRERQAVEMNQVNSDGGPFLGPLLDQVIDELRDEERTAILLRFFEQDDFRAIGQALGTSEDAARMRVNRALEKLEALLKRRGVKTSAAALTVALSANAVHAAPVGLAASISAASLANAAAGTSVLTSLKVMAMGKIKLGLLGAIVAAGLAAPFALQYNNAARLRRENESLQRQLDQSALLAADNLRLSNELARSSALLSAPADQSNELLRLRGEVSRMRKDSEELAQLKSGASSDSAESAARSWLNRVALLKQRVQQNPEVAIPEMQLLQQEDWLAAVKARQLDTEADYRLATAELRRAAEAKVAPLLQKGLKDYLQANSGKMPENIGQLQAYLDASITEPMLQRWQVAPASTVRSLGLGGDVVITQKAPIDDVFDTCFGVGPAGLGQTDFLSREVGETMNPVWQAYRTAHEGRWPDNVSELTPYATTPEQQVALNKLILKNSAPK